jgi:outer membrane protein TolC
MRLALCLTALMLFFSRGPIEVWAQTGNAPGEPHQLSIAETIKRGLEHNLVGLLGEQGIRSAQGTRLQALSDLLPKITSVTTQSREQINLEALGFSGFPGIHPIIGPISVFDTRLYLSQPILDFNARNKLKAEDENLRAAENSFKNARDQVILGCTTLYLQAVAGQSRIDSRMSQLATAQALYDLAVDRKKAGVASGIDVLRAQVQLQSQELRLIVARNDFAKGKLALAQAIGLPLNQEFTLADRITYSPSSAPALEAALDQAYKSRGDYQSFVAQIKAAEFRRDAAISEGRPAVKLDANYGIIGPSMGNSHGTFTVAASLRIPVFEGGQVRGKVLEADAVLLKAQAQLDDLRQRIDGELRSIFLDLRADDERVRVSQSAQLLAEEQVKEARDRFLAGVTNTIEVVQAQDALATASDSCISSLYELYIARAALARAMGYEQDAFERFLRGK